MYDYLVVGAGLFGSIFAHEIAKQGKKVKVIEKRSHIAGNIYTKEVNGIQVHEYGAHIFHTSNDYVWDYIQQFADFNHFINAPIANFNGEIYNLPFNMNTFNRLWGVVTPQEAKDKIEEQRLNALNNKQPENLEEQSISLVGVDIYNKLIKGYTEKQWGRPATELPTFIIKRLPVRYTYDNNYFNDKYQGIPVGGYTQIVHNLLNHPNIDIELNTDFFENKDHYLNDYPRIVFTGMIDAFFDYKFGELEYRSLKFEHDTIDCNNYQGNAVVNYTDAETPYTRIIEHQHFEPSAQPHKQTVITKEYPQNWQQGIEPYYPINDDRNNAIFDKYQEEAKKHPNIIFGGRLGQYKYYDMDKVIEAALDCVSKEIERLSY